MTLCSRFDDELDGTSSKVCMAESVISGPAWVMSDRFLAVGDMGTQNSELDLYFESYFNLIFLSRIGCFIRLDRQSPIFRLSASLPPATYLESTLVQLPAWSTANVGELKAANALDL